MRQPEFEEHRWQPYFRLRWTWTLGLIVAYVVVLIAQQLAGYLFHERGAEIVYGYFALSLDGLGHGYAWELLTYQFMHAGWLHLIFNAVTIFTFGSELEHLLGARRYLTLVFCSGIVGGVFQMAAALLWPTLFGGAVVGASACAFGLVAAIAMMFPRQELNILFIFVPVRLRAMTLLIVFIVIALVGVVFPLPGIRIAHAAHLGGMAMGWFYIKKIIKNPALLGVAEENSYSEPKPARRAEKPAEELDDADVDAVLDKISARGINSLTSRERAILEAARKKMAQR